MMNAKRAFYLLNLFLLAFGLTMAAILTSSFSEDSMRVGGAEMYPSKTIAQNAVNSADHTTLVAALKAAGLTETLQGPGPFTVFAPVNAAFNKLPPGTLDRLLQAENKAKLTSILTYHIVPVHMTSTNFAASAAAGGGKVILKTMEGDKLTIMKDAEGSWWVMDDSGNKAKITIANVLQSNGVIHVIDSFLIPAKVSLDRPSLR